MSDKKILNKIASIPDFRAYISEKIRTIELYMAESEIDAYIGSLLKDLKDIMEWLNNDK